MSLPADQWVCLADGVWSGCWPGVSLHLSPADTGLDLNLASLAGWRSSTATSGTPHISHTAAPSSCLGGRTGTLWWLSIVSSLLKEAVRSGWHLAIGCSACAHVDGWHGCGSNFEQGTSSSAATCCLQGVDLSGVAALGGKFSYIAIELSQTGTLFSRCLVTLTVV